MEKNIEADENIANEEERSLLERFKTSFRRTLYKFMTPLIGPEIFSITFKIIFFFIEVVQITTCAFKDNVFQLWKQTDQAKQIRDILNYSMIVPHLIKDSFGLYIFVFYFFIGLSAIILLFIFYINVLPTNKKIDNNFGYLVSKVFAELYLSVFFFPLFDLFFSIFQCQENKDQVLVMTYYQEVPCFQGTHIVYAFSSFIIMIPMIIYTFAICLLFFDTRLKSTSYTAKKSGRGEVFFTVFKMGLILMNLFIGEGYQLVYLGFYVIGSFLLFEKFNDSAYFYNYNILKINMLVHVLNTWTSLILVFGRFTKDIYFDFQLYVWILGIIVLGIIILLRMEFRYDLLLVNSNKIENLNTAINHLSYLTSFVRNYMSNKSVSILLDGFVEYHKTICHRDDCPTRKKFNNRKKLAKIIKDEGDNEQVLQLLHLIQSLYVINIQKFPKSTTLRIHLALFLFDKMKQPQQALQELIQAQSMRPSFDEEFIIYRMKRIIENELIESQKEENNSAEAVNELAYQNNIRQMKIQIEKSSNMHLEFWAHLAEDTPDLAKLCEVGNKINIVNNSIEDCWGILTRSNSDIPSLGRLYARFLLNILHDKEGSEKVMERYMICVNVLLKRELKISNQEAEF